MFERVDIVCMLEILSTITVPEEDASLPASGMRTCSPLQIPERKTPIVIQCSKVSSNFIL